MAAVINHFAPQKSCFHNAAQRVVRIRSQFVAVMKNVRPFDRRVGLKEDEIRVVSRSDGSFAAAQTGHARRTS